MTKPYSHAKTETSDTTCPQKWRWRHVETLTALLLLVLFAALALRDIEYPGILFDGPFIQRTALEVDQKLDVSFRVLLEEGVRTHWYHKIISGYLLGMFVHWFGVNFVFARFYVIAWGILAAVFMYLFVAEAFNRKAAFLALFLLLVHPPFLMGLKLGEKCGSHACFFSMATLFFLNRWWMSRGIANLSIGMLSFGLGLSTHLWYAWFMVAMGVMGIVLFPHLKRRLTPKIFAFSAVSFMIGISVFLYLDLPNFPTFRWVWAQISSASNPNGPRNYFANLIPTALGYSRILTGEEFLREQFGLNVFRRPDISIPLVLAASIPWILIPARSRLDSKRIVFILGIFILMFLQTPVYRSPTPPIHAFFVLYPFPQIVLGLAIYKLIQFWPRNKIPSIMGLTLLVFLGIRELKGMDRYLTLLRTSGGEGTFSSVIYDLSDWISQNRKGATIYTFDWYADIGTHLRFLNPGLDVRSLRVLAPTKGWSHPEVVYQRDLFSNKPGYVVVFLPTYPRDTESEASTMEYLKQLSSKFRKAVNRVRVFYDKNERAIFEVYSI